ncbi:DeoR/GlpR family DNA-binding transcription regulator [Tessaracoccus sp. OS52]|uniref:DeoR/GlpR family DNA-binding transcription regulator n=1 Tax=Tessaracoccus sp. OS52 TaxID=2886691 RepID=UPI001D106375|nr:DeoR/GlpR family DNA-binding transcription regulator [Tessaracoccus sp. OS52]MCC2594034.1 DeoR/GlpR family DNA-binding transcription regulator [Tessaracoccus sp. OS52]
MLGNMGGLPAEARRSRMRSLVYKRGFALVTDLAKLFEISEVTVRADLDALAEEGSVRRVHGGAMTVGDVQGHQTSFDEAAQERAYEKELIGRAAAGLVESHQVVAVDAGTTSMAIARALVKRTELRDITVVTNALNIALELEQAIPRVTVIVTGGTLRPALHCLVDPLAGTVLNRIRADIAFVGCNGVDVTAGVTNISLAEADVKRQIIQNATRTVLVADSSKLGLVRASRICPLSAVTVLVTDDSADPAAISAVRDVGVEVVVA